MSRICVNEFLELNWLNVHDRYLQFIVSDIFKFYNNQCPDYFNEVFCPIDDNRNSSSKDEEEIEAKNVRQKLPPGNWKKRGFQGKNKHKGNLLQHVFSTYNSNRRSEECSSMGKKLVLCKNNSKRATSRNFKAFFRSMGDTYKGPRNFRNCKGVQDIFSKKSKTEKSSTDATHAHMGHEQAVLIQVEIENMLKKGAMQQPEHQAGRFLSNILLVGKKIGEIELW